MNCSFKKLLFSRERRCCRFLLSISLSIYRQILAWIVLVIPDFSFLLKAQRILLY